MSKLHQTVAPWEWSLAPGQATRIVAAALFSWIWVPVGNTGGARVSALQPMPLPDDLRALLERDARAG